MRIVLARLGALLSLCVLAACASTPTYNPTTFSAEIDQAKITANPIKTVVIPHVNLGAPSRNYLEKEAPRIDGMIAGYLKENGYKVIPQREFQQRWSTGVRAFGNPIDPTTGKVNMRTFAQIMESIRDDMQKEFKLDAFVFTDLMELEVAFNIGMKHLARWDGVSRKPALQGPGDGVSVGFDWNQLAAVASLQIAIFDNQLQRVFFGRGGLDATEAIDTRSSSGRFTRRRNMLENETHLNEGIQLAFHPLIEMKAWPGNP
ncbi:hypothetical protein BST95_10060 [Halioglobus japonicus]|uniref:Lipoprotein n=1 Tax=Halioglobus japonicus TaxID=930805 RepID=A0AAP8MFT2_9GAMM|nr:hypothetical protein [Halioglobus japonicus]AQA20246.1 hypothetical protein BST95_10060 [Halioglobus japonicus]PLW86997.1 hypothetical protein C0029_09095 [Halioglobus japonicus]GHD12312.1 hypothetical protein GCM10007052_13030 [Halioglobus japonicus]